MSVQNMKDFTTQKINSFIVYDKAVSDDSAIFRIPDLFDQRHCGRGCERIKGFG